MRGTRKTSTRILSFVLSLIMVASTFMTDYTIARASEAVEETVTSETSSSDDVSETSDDTSEVEETSEADESETTEGEGAEATEDEAEGEDTEATESDVEGEDTEATEDEEVVEGEEELTEEELLEGEIVEILEEKIKISFKASEGGSVSMSEQELGEDDEVEAVTATADEGYEFVNWTKDGEEVSASEEFTPAKEEATYVANFEEVEEEELEFNQSVNSYGMKISLYAKPGVLPNDAELQVKKVSSTLEKEIKEAIDSETEGTVEETISFDINIYSASAGEYVQPEDGTVSVTFELLNVDTEDKEVSVYHVEENGSSVSAVEEVAAPVENADEVAFEAEHFSVYTVTIKVKENEKIAVPIKCYEVTGGYQGTHTEIKGRDTNISLAIGEAILINPDGSVYKRKKDGSSEELKQFAINGYKLNCAYEKNSNGKGHQGSTDAKVVEIKAVQNKNNKYGIKYKLEDGKEKSNGDMSFCFHYEKINTVYYYLVKPTAKVPSDATDKNKENYYPTSQEKYHDWEGTAAPLPNGTESIYGADEVERYLRGIPKNEINEYLRSKEGSGYGTNVTAEDIVWYTYKKVNNPWNWSAKEYHIDGYIKNASVEVVYNSNYPGNKTDETWIDKNQKTGEYKIKEKPVEWKVNGYTFAGWALSSKINDTSTIYSENSLYTLKTSTVFYAVWKKNPSQTYTVTYDLDGGVLEEGKTNPTSYTVETATFTLSNPTRTGYTFAGWIGTDLTEATKTVTVKQGSTGNRIYTATWEVKKVDVSVKKAWNDADNQDGIRPGSVEVQLYADGVPSGSAVTLNKDNSWAYTWNVAAYNNDKAVVYTVNEVAVPTGYAKAITGDATKGFVITNTHTPELTEATVKKVWDDAEDQDGIRPDGLKVTLSNGTEVTLNEANKWTATVTDLPKYANGVEISYTWTEANVESYDLTAVSKDGTVTTLTNSYTPETTEVTVVKAWDDAKNQDGKRPSSLAVTLSNETETVETVTLNDANNWTATVENLPKYAAGEEIVYTWTEGEMPEGYSLTGTSKDGTVTTLTNSYTPEETSVFVRKIWDDAKNQDGKRPESIVVNLLANGEQIATGNISSKLVWKWTGVERVWEDSYIFTDLPKYAGGKEIEYTIEEEAVKDYTSKIDKINGGYQITNSYTPETITLSGTKTWNDANNQDGIRPESIQVKLYANSRGVDSVEVKPDAEGNWNYSFEDLPKYADGRTIYYSVYEEFVRGYIPSYEKTENGYDIVNTHIPEQVAIYVEKVWNDGNNQDGKRPTDITVNIKADGNVEKTVTIEHRKFAWFDFGWTYSTILPKYAGGNEIEYTVEEISVTDYESTYSDAEWKLIDHTWGYAFKITNTHIPEVTEATVMKVWDDDDNQDGKRPESLTVTLSNGTEVTLNDENDWTATVENLPVYSNGQKIEYTWTENLTEDSVYQLTDTSVEGTVTTLTNSYTPETVSVSGTKTWNDANNQDRIRPIDITVVLLADGAEIPVGDDVLKATTSATEGWKYEFKDLPKYAAGKEIVYAIKELAIPGYTTTYSEAVIGDGVIILDLTNNHTPTPPSGGGGGGGSSSGGGSGRSGSDVGRVLGARREDIATAGEEGQVLGAVRAPKTSDSSRAILWMLVMGTSALGAAAILAQKKNEEEN